MGDSTDAGDSTDVGDSTDAVATTMWGIPNCDTMRKARRWLEEHGVEYEFRDYAKVGIDADRLQAWSARVGWDQLLNRRGTTYRKLDESERDGLDGAKAIGLMVAHPSLVKRPVIERGDEVIVGFDDTLYTKLFGL